MMYDSCYVVTFYFGDRRRTFPPYEEDRLCYLKKQIEYLTDVKHSLKTIYFVFNVEIEHYELLSDALKIIPKSINDSKIEIIVRENIGFSYGGWTEVMNRLEHDYYIVNEDDYFFIEDNWDSYMINNFNEKENCGGFGIAVRPANEWNGYKEHFAHSCFCTNKDVIKNIIKNYNGFKVVKNNDYKENESNQSNFSNLLISAGYRIYDIREDYDLNFAMTDKPNIIKIHKMFYYNNNKHLIIPDIVAFNLPYTWWTSWDYEFNKDFRLKYPHVN